MEPTPPHISGFFSKYEELVNKRSFSEQAKMLGKQVIAAGPKGELYHKNNFVTRLFFSRAMKSYYNKIGLTSMIIKGINYNRVSNEYGIARVTWQASLRKVEQPVAFDISYVVRADEPRIVMYVAHDDEETLLKELGVL